MSLTLVAKVSVRVTFCDWRAAAASQCVFDLAFTVFGGFTGWLIVYVVGDVDRPSRQDARYDCGSLLRCDVKSSREDTHDVWGCKKV